MVVAHHLLHATVILGEEFWSHEGNLVDHFAHHRFMLRSFLNVGQFHGVEFGQKGPTVVKDGNRGEVVGRSSVGSSSSWGVLSLGRLLAAMPVGATQATVNCSAAAAS
jgi:hypothetical protein